MSGPATEKFALRWNDFESNICQAFKRLKDDRDLCDVTCVCEDDQEVEAHKVVLASCSQFFDKIFKKYKNKQVVLYLKGVSCHQLKSLMSFMYLGQVSVSQEELSSFLQAAEELQVRGLAQGNTHTPGQSTHSDSKLTGRHLGDHQPQAQPPSPEVVKPEEFPEEQHDQVTQVYEEDEYADPDVFYVTGTGSGELGWDHDASNKDLFESLTESFLTSVLDTTKGKLWTCKQCGKQVKNKPNLQHHIEANHIEEQSNRYSCQYCHTRKSTYKALMKHLYKDHRGNVMQRVH